MSKLGDDLIQSLKEALAHARGDGPGTEHAPATLRGPGERSTAVTVKTDGSSELPGHQETISDLEFK